VINHHLIFSRVYARFWRGLDLKVFDSAPVSGRLPDELGPGFARHTYQKPAPISP